MEDFAQNACPTQKCVEDSLRILRKYPEPFAPAELEARLDLLFLPFLSGISSLEQRVDRLKVALDYVASDLSVEQGILYRHLFQQPTERFPTHRQRCALDEINQLPTHGDKERVTARNIEDKLLSRLAATLLSPAFVAELEDRFPPPPQLTRRRSTGALFAFEQKSYECSLEIDGADPRKQKEHRTLRVRTRLPDQRVIGIRYYTHRSPPTPVENGVTVLSDGHTYLGTFRDLPPSSAGDWWMHFVHLGRRHELGETATISLQESYFDKDMQDRPLSLTYQSRFDSVESVRLAVRLPVARIDGVRAEAREVEDPHAEARTLGSWELPIADDGWVTLEFSSVQRGLQYGIFIPDFDLYKG